MAATPVGRHRVEIEILEYRLLGDFIEQMIGG